MKLILTVTSQQYSSLGPDGQHIFDTRGGSIGRSHTSDWVLPDTNLIVSKRHAIIDFRDGGFFLTDTSTNGVFLNDSDLPLGNHNVVSLHDGDRIAIGEYRIRVELDLSDGYPASLFQDDHPHLTDSVMCRSVWQAKDKSEPLPLGLSSEDGFRLESKSSLPGRGAAADGDFDSPASQPDHTPAINDAFSAPSAHVEKLPEDWDKVAIKSGVSRSGDVSQQKSFQADNGVQSSWPPHQMSDSTPDDKSYETAVDAGNGINEFLRGAGVDTGNKQVDSPKLSLEELGRLYREMVQGVMEVLIARSSLKNEFRMPHTIVRATENNPLKFSMGVDDALEYLLFKQGEGFLPPEQAFREAYQDIKEHQFATVVGMRSAFNALLRLFEPERLQSRFKKGSKRKGLLSRNSKAENWEFYEKWFAELLADTDDHFQQLFAAEFGRAYEEEIQRLSTSRR